MDNKSPPAAFRAAPILPFVAGALAVAIFAIDTLVPLDSAIAALYAIVVLLAANYFQERGVILLVSGGCLALTVLSFLAQHSLTADEALVRCLVSLLAIGATTFLALKNTRLYRDLAEREAKIRRLVDANIIGIVIWDFEGRVIEANDAFLRMVDYDREDLVSGRIRWTELTPPEWLDRDERQWLPELKVTGSLQPVEKEYFRKDGGRVPVLIGAATFEERGNQGVAFVLDLTERKRAEAELAHVSRVTTLGQLTASIAHEIMQPIASARNNARAALIFLNEQPTDLGEVREALDGVVGDAGRAGDIVDRIRDQIKKAPPRKRRLDLNEAINEVVEFARSAIAENGVSVQTRLNEALPPVEGDRVQLQQVVLNLILNAVEAMSSVEAGARELLISTEESQTGGVLVAVRDSGPGIGPEHLERVFEAFHTTKPNGIGMGLSICRSIIVAHGGRLWAEANEPRGAVFQFTVPGAEKELMTSLLAAQQTGEPHEDTGSDRLHQAAFEDNRRPRRSGRGPGRRHRGRPSRGSSEWDSPRQ